MLLLSLVYKVCHYIDAVELCPYLKEIFDAVTTITAHSTANGDGKTAQRTASKNSGKDKRKIDVESRREL